MSRTCSGGLFRNTFDLVSTPLAFGLQLCKNQHFVTVLNALSKKAPWCRVLLEWVLKQSFFSLAANNCRINWNLKVFASRRVLSLTQINSWLLRYHGIKVKTLILPPLGGGCLHCFRNNIADDKVGILGSALISYHIYGTLSKIFKFGKLLFILSLLRVSFVVNDWLLLDYVLKRREIGFYLLQMAWLGVRWLASPFSVLIWLIASSLGLYFVFDLLILRGHHINDAVIDLSVWLFLKYDGV